MDLLIIDDKAEMIKLIQKQFSLLNNKYRIENTYCFSSENNELNIRCLTDTDELNDITFPADTIQLILEKIDEQINNSTESIFIVIDMCLISDHLGTYDVEDYYADNEFSAEIYKHLIELKNSDIRYNNLYFLVYSRSETFVEIFSKVLKTLHQKLKNENMDIENFPYESCESSNLSWCVNLWRSGTNESEKLRNKTFPLYLSEGIISFIEKM